MAAKLWDLANWANNFFPKEIQKFAVEQKANAALVGLVQLVNTTPVDTSQALSNWQVVMGDANEVEPIPAHEPGRMGSTQAESAEVAVAAGSVALQEFTESGVPIHIMNVLDYIVGLDQGNSRQAPNGFVDAAMIVMKDTLENR